MSEVYDYAPISATALRLIAKFGRPITVRAVPATAATAGQEWLGRAAPVDYSVQAVWVDRSSMKNQATLAESIEGSFLVAGSSFPAGFDPKTADGIVDGALTYRIVEAQRTAPGDTAVLYTFVVEA